MNIVEVTAKILKKGDNGNYNDYVYNCLMEKNIDATVKMLDNIINDYSKWDNHNIDNIKFIEDNIRFTFRWVGNSYNRKTIIDNLYIKYGVDIFKKDINKYINWVKNKKIIESTYYKFLVKYNCTILKNNIVLHSGELYEN